METGWLVITDKVAPYVERYKVFSEDKFDKALKWAKELGYQDIFGLGIDNKIGMVNMYQAEYMVGIMHIEIN